MDRESIGLGILLAAVGLVIFVAFDSLMMVVLYSLKKGQFRVRRIDAKYISLVTDLGQFMFNGEKRLVRITGDQGVREVALESIDRLDLRYRTEMALAAELARGWDLWDLVRKYRDVVEWYEIDAVAGTMRIPLYVVGQYEPREPFGEGWFAFQARLLGRVGLFQDVAETAQEVLQEIEEIFRASGRTLSLAMPARVAG